jgi:hypothetical protein
MNNDRNMNQETGTILETGKIYALSILLLYGCKPPWAANFPIKKQKNNRIYGAIYR